MPRISATMIRLVSFLTTLLFVVNLAAAEARTPVPARTPSISAEEAKCYLSVVDGLVQACCEKTGQFLDGTTNCTDFAYNFDKLCSHALGPENCFFVRVSCPHSPFGHRLNMVKLSDGLYYVVEPQGEIYYDHPLPSPNIPDALLCQIIKGCGCSAIVQPYSIEPNTWDMCADNDAQLIRGYPLRPGPEMLPRCLACCDVAVIPPMHPDPDSFTEMCKFRCNSVYSPEPGEADDFFSRYCYHRYVGRQCRICCAYLQEGKQCEDSCEEGHGHTIFIEIPPKEPTYCRGRYSATAACNDCCNEQRSLCTGLGSVPCVGWAQQCFKACQTPVPPPTSRPSPKPSPQK